MASTQTTAQAPLTFDIQDDLLSILNNFIKKSGIKSKSAAIRHAIEHYSFSKFKSSSRTHKQLSVRLPEAIKTKLLMLSRDKQVSIGELLRATIEALPSAPKNQITSNPSKKPMAVKKKTTKAKKAVKKTVKKAKKAVKKTVAKAKKAVKKASSPKKTTKKKVATKKTAKKVATKKVAKKAAPKKTTVKRKTAKKI